jgi:hypothetical protein
MATKASTQLNALLCGESQCSCGNGVECKGLRSHKRHIVHIHKLAHQKLAVHTINDASVPRDEITKVLNLESALHCETPRTFVEMYDSNHVTGDQNERGSG